MRRGIQQLRCLLESRTCIERLKILCARSWFPQPSPWTRSKAGQRPAESLTVGARGLRGRGTSFLGPVGCSFDRKSSNRPGKRIFVSPVRKGRGDVVRTSLWPPGLGEREPVCHRNIRMASRVGAVEDACSVMLARITGRANLRVEKGSWVGTAPDPLRLLQGSHPADETCGARVVHDSVTVAEGGSVFVRRAGKREWARFDVSVCH